MSIQGIIIIGLLVCVGYSGIFWLYGVKHWFFWVIIITLATIVSLQLILEFLAPVS